MAGGLASAATGVHVASALGATPAHHSAVVHVAKPRPTEEPVAVPQPEVPAAQGVNAAGGGGRAAAAAAAAVAAGRLAGNRAGAT